MEGKAKQIELMRISLPKRCIETYKLIVISRGDFSTLTDNQCEYFESYGFAFVIDKIHNGQFFITDKY